MLKLFYLGHGMAVGSQNNCRAFNEKTMINTSKLELCDLSTFFRCLCPSLTCFTPAAESIKSIFLTAPDLTCLFIFIFWFPIDINLEFVGSKYRV